jgi:DNA-binding winged helix-turn-helix (wHTH) protein
VETGNYRLGALKISPKDRVVSLGDQKIDLPWRCFEALLVLIEADGQVVERQVFFQRLWPNATVEESNLNQAIARLRKELGTAGDIIETVPRRGYRLLVRPERVTAGTAHPELPIAVTHPSEHPRSWRGWVNIAAAMTIPCLAAVLLAWPAWSKHRQALALVDEGFRLVRENRTAQVGQARTFFTRALDLDPKLALGYAGLAEAMARSVDGSRIHAKAMADRSLQIDPQCAACQGIAGWILLTDEWQFARGFRYLESAARRQPSDPTIQLWYAQATACSGRLDQALRQIDKTVALNPTDAGAHAMRAGILYFMRRYDESIVAARLALGLRAGYTGATDWIYRSGMACGLIEEALAARAALIASFSGLSFDGRQDLERRWNEAYRSGGLKNLVGELLKDSSVGLAHTQQVYDRATLRMWAGDSQGALDELEHVFEFHPFHCIYLGVDPAFAPVRDDPRFRRILTRIGIDQILIAQK